MKRKGIRMTLTPDRTEEPNLLQDPFAQPLVPPR